MGHLFALIWNIGYFESGNTYVILSYHKIQMLSPLKVMNAYCFLKRKKIWSDIAQKYREHFGRREGLTGILLNIKTWVRTPQKYRSFGWERTWNNQGYLVNVLMNWKFHLFQSNKNEVIFHYQPAWLYEFSTTKEINLWGQRMQPFEWYHIRFLTGKKEIWQNFKLLLFYCILKILSPAPFPRF